MNEERDVIAYLRTAFFDKTEEQLYKQKLEILDHCKENNMRLVRVFYDNGVSGLTFDREGWKALRRYAEEHKGKLDSVLVTDYSRISRNVGRLVKEMESLKDKYGLETVLAKNQNVLEATKEVFKEIVKPKWKHRIR